MMPAGVRARISDIDRIPARKCLVACKRLAAVERWPQKGLSNGRAWRRGSERPNYGRGVPFCPESFGA